MKNAYILHGICDAEEYYELDFPSPSNAHWLPWLQQKFLRAEVVCQTLEMPKPHKPTFEEWQQTWETHAQVTPETTIVAHSAGCGFILKWMTDKPNVHLHKLVLVAPWLDPQKTLGDFLTCSLAKDIQERVGEFHIFYAENEDVLGVEESKNQILKTYPRAILKIFPTHGHFCMGDMGTQVFPELWDVAKPS